MFIAH